MEPSNNKMPYTPPSHRSPASSTTTSPDVSRRPSFHQSPTNGNSRPTLPRSASYLARHQRTASAPTMPPRRPSEPTPESTSEDLRGMLITSSVRQSPPPVTGDRGMPNAAIISPPDSSSEDDDLPEIRGEVRGRQIENLEELQDAISQIPQQRSNSPNGVQRAAGDLPEAISEGMHHSFSTGSLDELAVRGNRRVSHARSATEPDIPLINTADSSLTGSEMDSEEEAQRKPQMVRKKSGELVRPALRASSRRRPSSMPGTPTFSKAVHFDSRLEHVRHFLQVDRPLAVSAGSSPVDDNYNSDNEYPFPDSSPPFEWDLVLSNFPAETPARRLQPVWLERVWLSFDQKSLIGSVVVANLAFQKFVACRFTLDYWKTTSEVGAEYFNEVTPRQNPVGSDRFHFTIKLSDMANLENKTLYFCIRYNVVGQEHWDNNSGMNFQVDFHKKAVPRNGKRGVIGAASRPLNGLPRSTRRQNPSTAPRPNSMPVDINDFGDSEGIWDDQSLDDYLGEVAPKALRLKGVKSTSSLPSDNLASRLPAPSGQAFANRYDFGASLSAARSGKSDGLYMKSFKKSQDPSTTNCNTNGTADNETASGSETAIQSAPATNGTTASGADSPSGSIASSSYEELVNRYCFFGTRQPGHHTENVAPRTGHLDGPGDMTRSGNTSNTSSYDGSPVQMGNYYHTHNGTQHHSLHPKDPNPYFEHTSPYMTTMYTSPSQSPLQIYSPQFPVGSIATRPASDRSSSPMAPGGFAHYTEDEESFSQGSSSDESPTSHESSSDESSSQDSSGEESSHSEQPH